MLRGSGATHFYRCWVPIADIAWRGRWRQLRNLEYYLQEVAGTELLQGLPADAVDRIGLLAGAADVLTDQVLIRGLAPTACERQRRGGET